MTLKMTANAKINSILSVEGKREDGYHLIDSVFQSVSLSDKIKLKKDKNVSLLCNVKELGDDQNIAIKAAKMFFGETEINGGVKIKLKKKIPLAAGLGGGSADAAAVLLGLNKLYDTKLSAECLKAMALKLGADVPFFLEGGTVRAKGVGEEMTKLNPFREGFFILLKIGTKPSTGEMYRKLDSENPKKPLVEEFAAAIENGDTETVIKLFDNSFKCCWKKSEAEQILRQTADAVSLTGSGPTWFGFYKDKHKAKKAYKTIKKRYKFCYLVKPSEKAVIFE